MEKTAGWPVTGKMSFFSTFIILFGIYKCRIQHCVGVADNWRTVYFSSLKCYLDYTSVEYSIV